MGQGCGKPRSGGAGLSLGLTVAGSGRTATWQEWAVGGLVLYMEVWFRRTTCVEYSIANCATTSCQGYETVSALCTTRYQSNGNRGL